MATRYGYQPDPPTTRPGVPPPTPPPRGGTAVVDSPLARPPKPTPPQNRLEYAGRIYCSRTPEEFAYWEAELARRCRRDRAVMETVFWLGIVVVLGCGAMALMNR